MNNDLISRAALLEAIRTDVAPFTLSMVFRHIHSAPAVDAVEVVRCKDCKWYKEGKLLSPNKFCFRLKHPREDRKIGYNFSPDDFCSYGERRENNG